jgi:hypothetical protein
MQAVTSAALAAVWSLANAWGGGYTLEVRNGPHARRDAVVSQAVTRDWVELARSRSLVETTGGLELPVPFALDASGEAPVLSFLLRGETAADTRRTFAWSARGAGAGFDSDLRVFTNAASVCMGNAFFRLEHPARGGGGFPRNVAFSRSAQEDPRLYFLDRAVRPKAEGGPLASYCAKDCEDACARVVFASPLRVVVETRTGFGRVGADTPGRPQAVYRYAYTANSPVVEVSARYSREDDAPWRELHFLHLTRADRHYASFVTGDPAQTHAMQPKGARSRAVSAPQWAVMADGTNACGVGCEGALCWDASDEFVYYVRRACAPWEGRACGYDGSLYFGPAGDAAWYSAWLGAERRPEVRCFKDGRPWVPVEPAPARGEHELLGRELKLAFAGAERGFDCVGVENRLAGGARFVNARPEEAGLWALTFSGGGETARLDNRAAARRVTAERGRDALTFCWTGLSLPGEAACVDVRAEVRLAAGASEWRLFVTNRSARFGLFATDYPLLRGVAPRGAADVLLPRGNWGGSLLPHFAGAYSGRYPSHGCPVQMMAFQLGEAGLYVAAHDGGARPKELSVSRELSATVRVPAADAGVPGAAGAPDFPVVVAAYTGDWWEAARRYRAWATKQAWTAKGPIGSRADYPARMRDVGFWMLLSGAPDGVAKNMEQAAALYPGMPLGVHWYSWHQIPFDNSYPEYFPTKPGMPEATRAMAAQGVTVMPYINARLWDRDIPSFAGAWAASCKQPSGTNYVETYGSGRSLVPMCPHTKLWQGKVQEVCGRLLDECGVGGIYLDQIGSAAPVLCYDASHGHPLGGGRHWVDGYHAMLRQVKDAAARRGALLTTEDSAEPYMDVIDGCLAWNERRQEDVPLLPAIYSGYTVYFTSPQAAHDSLDAFCAAQGRDFLWGCQLGWNDPWILREEHREKQRFQLELCRLRLAAKEFLVCGQLVDELRLDEPAPVLAETWNRRQPHLARVPAVMGTVWRDSASRLAVFAVNASGSPQRASFRVDPARWGCGRGPWRVSELTAGGARPLDAGAGRVLLGDLPPHSARALVLEKAP